MSENIHRGESLTIVLRCRDPEKEGIDMSGKKVDVQLVDRKGKTIYSFSTDEGALNRVTVEGCYLLCHLAYSEMKGLQGVYMIEVRIEEEGVVRIAQLPGIRILDSFIGKKF